MNWWGWFNLMKICIFMKDAGPTWYTAVPTMHQAILSRAERNTIGPTPIISVGSTLKHFGQQTVDHILALAPLCFCHRVTLIE